MLEGDSGQAQYYFLVHQRRVPYAENGSVLGGELLARHRLANLGTVIGCFLLYSMGN